MAIRSQLAKLEGGPKIAMSYDDADDEVTYFDRLDGNYDTLSDEIARYRARVKEILDPRIFPPNEMPVFPMEWTRPLYEPEDDGSFNVMNTAFSMTLSNAHPRFGARVPAGTRVPVMRVFGVTRNGASALVNVHGYLPYLYIQLSRAGVGLLDALDVDEEGEVLQVVQTYFETLLATKRGGYQEHYDEEQDCVTLVKPGFGRATDDRNPGASYTREKKEVFVVSVKREQHKSLIGYTNEAISCLKITLSSPHNIATVAKHMEHDVFRGAGVNPFLPASRVHTDSVLPPVAVNQTFIAALFDPVLYENNMDMLVRFMGDVGIRGDAWFSALAGTYLHTPQWCRQSSPEYVSAEIDMCFTDIVPRDHEVSPWDVIAPMRSMSFDLECSGSKGEFPNALNPDDYVIQAAFSVKTYGTAQKTMIKNEKLTGNERSKLVRVVLCLGRSAQRADSGYVLYEFSSPNTFFMAMALFVRCMDPDIITVRICSCLEAIVLARSRNSSTRSVPFM